MRQAPLKQARHQVRVATVTSLFLIFAAMLHGMSHTADTPRAPAQRVYQISSFGALPDGVHDNSLAIQRAVQAAIASGGGTIHFPCGNWRTDTVINQAPADRSALYFRGISNIAFQGEGRCSRVFTTIPARTVFEIRDSTNVSFEKLLVEPAQAVFHEHYQNDGGSAIRLAGVHGGSIEKVEMSGGSSALLWLNAGTTGYSVRASYFHDSFGNAAIWEDDCSAEDNSSGCGLSRPPFGNSIEDNLFVQNGTTGGNAQIVLDSGGHLTKTRVAGNTIRGRDEPHNPHIHGIQVENASGAVIEANHLIDASQDAIAVTADNNMTISGTQILRNTIEGGCRDSGIILYASPAGRIEQTMVRDNRISSVQGRGIVLYGTIASHIHNTDIVGNELHGVRSGSPIFLDAIVIRGQSVRLLNNVLAPANEEQRIGITIDPDSADVSGVSSNHRTGSGALQIFDPGGVSDAPNHNPGSRSPG
jgi:hypothetical protein